MCALIFFGLLGEEFLNGCFCFPGNALRSPAAIASQNHAFSDLLLLRVTRGGVASCHELTTSGGGGVACGGGSQQQ